VAGRAAQTIALVTCTGVLAVLAWQHGTGPRAVATHVNAELTQATPGTASDASLPPSPSASSISAGSSGLRVVNQPVSFRDETERRGPGPQLEMRAGILVDIDRGTILWARNAHRALPPASTTKVLSSLLALENFQPEQPVTVTQDALTQDPDETVMGLKAGQRLTVRELLTGMLTVSANDGATALATDTVGLQNFVAAMNAQVHALGLQDSSFTTPVGLDDPRQLASPYDLAAIAFVDYTRFPLFRELVGSHQIELPATAGHPQYSLRNLNQLLEMYPSAVGIKPGYTGGAGACLIGMAVRDGHRLLSVVMGGTRLYPESSALLDWGFTQEGLSPVLPPTPPVTPRMPPKA
jgi:D-alanyl-D-alanine carboxypeptidase (penicillin-binding protein 5/6)